MKQKWWSSLRFKIIAWSFVPTVIILSAVAWFTFYSYQKVLGDLAIKQDRAMVQTIAGQYIAAVQNLINPPLVKIIYEVDTNRAIPLETRAQNILDHMPGIEVFDGGIYFLDQLGKVFRAYPEQPDLVGLDLSYTPQFSYIQRNPNVGAFTDVLSFGEPENKKVCIVSALTDQDGKIVGAAYYCLAILPVSPSIYYQTVNALDLGENLYVLDRNQQVIFSTDPTQIGKDLSGKTYLQQLMRGENIGGRFRNATEDRLVSSIHLTNEPDALGWIVVKEQSWDEIMQPTASYRRLLLVLLALGVIVPVLVTAYGVRHITEPIQKLIHAAQQVTAGQFKHRISVKTGDEIEILADQFNMMSAKLDESYSSLEKKVADRTRELAVMNETLAVASRSLDIQEILEDALDTTVEQMGFDAGAAFRFEPDQASVSLVAYRGLISEPVADLLKGKSFPNQALPVFPKGVAPFGLAEIQDEKVRKTLSESGLQLFVYIPLSTKGREQGFFVLGMREPGKALSEERPLLVSIGQQIGVAMENAQLYEQAEQSAIVAERSRLARELHDAVTQTLFSASLIADVIPQIWKRNPEEGMQNLTELRQLTRGALAEMRMLLLEMRPESLQRAELKSLLTQLADAFVGRIRIPVDVQLHGECAVTHEVKIVFYRVAQEALNNIARHAGARQVALHLDCQSGQMRLWIQDDGLGFDPGAIPPGHMGVSIMRERAATIGAKLRIESQLGQGTTVEMNWKPAQEEG